MQRKGNVRDKIFYLKTRITFNVVEIQSQLRNTIIENIYHLDI
jgi:hypothetical protein